MRGAGAGEPTLLVRITNSLSYRYRYSCSGDALHPTSHSLPFTNPPSEIASARNFHRSISGCSKRALISLAFSSSFIRLLLLQLLLSAIPGARWEEYRYLQCLPYYYDTVIGVCNLKLQLEHKTTKFRAILALALPLSNGVRRRLGITFLRSPLFLVSQVWSLHRE